MATGTAIPLIHGPASERLRRIATYASVTVAAVLIAVKFAAWLETGSVALLSSLVDSLLDIVASLVNLVAVRHAMSPADREHRCRFCGRNSVDGVIEHLLQPSMPDPVRRWNRRAHGRR